MERALEVASTESPLKASVESVLPGVQQRFTDVQNQLKQLQDTISIRPWMERKSLALFSCCLPPLPSYNHPFVVEKLWKCSKC